MRPDVEARSTDDNPESLIACTPHDFSSERQQALVQTAHALRCPDFYERRVGTTHDLAFICTCSEEDGSAAGEAIARDNAGVRAV